MPKNNVVLKESKLFPKELREKRLMTPMGKQSNAKTKGNLL